MDFKEKIDKVLEIRGIKLWRLAQESKLNSTLEKAYAENREMTETMTTKFLQNLGINSGWWETGKGDVFEETQQMEEAHYPTLLQILMESVKGVNKLVDANNGLVGELSKDKNWAMSELQKLHARFGIPKKT